MIQSVKKILSPVDFSEPSMKALASAWELAKEVDADEFHLLHIVTPHHLLGIEALPVGGREIAREASMIEQAEEELARIKKDHLENSEKWSPQPRSARPRSRSASTRANTASI